MSDRTDLHVVDFHDAAVGDQGRVHQRGLGRPDDLHGHARLGGDPHPFVGGDLGDGIFHRAVECVQHDHLAGVDRHPERRVLGGGDDPVGLLAGDLLGGAEDEPGQRHPMVGPDAVGRAEETFRRVGIDDPRLEAGPVEVLDLLPGPDGGEQHPLEQRRRDPLAGTALLALTQCCADRQRREVAGGHAGPRHPAEQRPFPRWADAAIVVGRFEAGHQTGASRQPFDGPADHAAVLPLLAGARRDQRVDPRALGVFVVGAVARDRAVHEAGVERRQRGVADAEPIGGTRSEALDHDVGAAREAEERITSLDGAQIDDGAALAACPCPGTGQFRDRVTFGSLDPGHQGAVIGEQHRGDGTADSPGQIEHRDPGEHSCIHGYPSIGGTPRVAADGAERAGIRTEASAPL